MISELQQIRYKDTDSPFVRVLSRIPMAAGEAGATASIEFLGVSILSAPRRVLLNPLILLGRWDTDITLAHRAVRRACRHRPSYWMRLQPGRSSRASRHHSRHGGPPTGRNARNFRGRGRSRARRRPHKPRISEQLRGRVARSAVGVECGAEWD